MKAWPNQQSVNLHRSTRTEYPMNVDFLKHGFRFKASWRLKKVFEVWRCRCEQWLPEPLENSSCPTNIHKSFLHSLLQVAEVILLLQHKQTPDAPRGKTLRDLNRGRKRYCFLPTSSYTLFRKHVVQELRKCKKKMLWSTRMHEP